MPNSWASVRMGVAQTFSYSSARVRRIRLWLISRSYRREDLATIVRFCCDASTVDTLQSNKGLRTPSATRAAGNPARGLRGLPELFATIEEVCIALTCTCTSNIKATDAPWQQRYRRSCDFWREFWERFSNLAPFLPASCGIANAGLTLAVFVIFKYLARNMLAFTRSDRVQRVLPTPLPLL
jgi:hypothetical protein